LSDERNPGAAANPADTDIDGLWDFDDPAATEAKFMALRQHLGAKQDHAKLLELDTQLARTQGLQGRYAHALMTLETVQDRLEPGEVRAAARHDLEMGRVLRSSGSPAGAKEYFERAARVAKEAGEAALEIDALHMLALVEPEPTRRIAMNMDALERAAGASDPRARRWRGSLWNNTGMDFHELGDLDRAMEAFEASLAAWQEDDPDRAGVAKWMIGWTMRLQGRLAEALAAQEALEHEYAASGNPGAGYVEEELGEIHLAWSGDDAWKHRGLARPYFARAYELLSANGEIDHDPDRLARIKSLAEGEAE
jgi:tetratricopeptide (TPR) repeat protein